MRVRYSDLMFTVTWGSVIKDQFRCKYSFPWFTALFLVGFTPNLSKSTQRVFMDGLFSRLDHQDTTQMIVSSPQQERNCRWKCMRGNYENSRRLWIRQQRGMEKEDKKKYICFCVNADGTHILRGINHITDSDNKSKPNPQLMMVLQVKKKKIQKLYLTLQ